MTDDSGAGTGGMSFATFAAVVFAAAALVMGGLIYLLSSGGDSSSAASPHDAPASIFIANPHTSTKVSGKPTRAGAVAVVKRNFDLSAQGRFAAACALESPAYLAFDAQHYVHGSCAAENAYLLGLMKAKGLSIRLLGTRLTSFRGERATVIVRAQVGRAVQDLHVYVQHHRGRWWLTGGDDSRTDLGY